VGAFRFTEVRGASLDSKNYLPKRVFAVDFKADGKLAEFSIQMENRIGMIATLSMAVSKHNVKILSGLHDAPSGADRGTWAFFADFTGADIEVEALAVELRSVPSVLEVRVQTGHDGFIADTLHFPRLLGSERVTIVRSAMLESIGQRLRAMWGEDSPIPHVLLHQIGEASGERAFDAIKSVLGFAYVRRNVESAASLFTALGWGILELNAIDLDGKTALVLIHDGFECASSTGKATAPQCDFTRGMLSGWFSGLFESKVNVIENACVAKGNPTCVFQVDPTRQETT